MASGGLTASRSLVIGTRKSPLALRQTESVKASLLALHPEISIDFKYITTRGDQSQVRDEPLPEIGGKGLFTLELEHELLAGTIDLAVHSLKDLPVKLDPRFTIGAVCKRESARDVLVSRDGLRLDELPRGAVVGTCSVRRSAQIRHMRPDLELASIRGNVDSRLAKLHNPALRFNAIVLAEAGLNRLGHAERITQCFDYSEMVPAPGQGALGIQCRSDDSAALQLLASLNDASTEAEVAVERTFLAMLDAGCNTPIGCIARCEEGRLFAMARCLSRDGERVLEIEANGTVENARALGRRLGEEALQRGVKNLDL